jgi:hypothetical protein
MADHRLLPFLAAASREALGGQREENTIEGIEKQARLAIAQKVDTSQNTVDRFLKGETMPRGKDLDAMVSAVADASGGSWLGLWLKAGQLAAEASEAGGPEDLAKVAEELAAVTKRLA